MRGLVVAVLFCLAGAAGAGDKKPPTFDFRIVERVELACAIGVEKAKNEDEAAASLRWRNGALEAIVEITYQATLAWLSERRDLVAALESEQDLWMAALGSMPKETREQLDEEARLLHRRLAVFMTITTGDFAAAAPVAAEGGD